MKKISLPKFEAKPMTDKEKMIYRLTIGLLLGIIGLVSIKLFMPQATLDYVMWAEYQYLVAGVIMSKWELVMYAFLGALLLPFVLPWTIYRKRDGQHVRATACLRRSLRHSDSVAQITTLVKGNKIYVADYRVFRIVNMVVIFGNYKQFQDGKDIILEEKDEIHENTLLRHQLALKEAEIADIKRRINYMLSIMDDTKMNKTIAQMGEDHDDELSRGRH